LVIKLTAETTVAINHHLAWN